MADYSGGLVGLPAYGSGGTAGGFDGTPMPLGAGVAAFQHFAMRGQMSNPPYLMVYWTVIDSPDFGGSQAPATVTTSSVVCMAAWTE